MPLDTQAEVKVKVPESVSKSVSTEAIKLDVGLLSGLHLSPKETERVYGNIKSAWENLVSVDGGAMAEHSERTAYFAHELALAYQRLFLKPNGKPVSNDDVKNWTLGALLHDIGKGTVVGDVFKYRDLITNGRSLTERERVEMAAHAPDGYEILIRAGLPEEVAQVARDHHNIKGGTGIPTILAHIADHYDAATDKKRVWREAMNPSDAFINVRERDVIPLAQAHPDLHLYQVYETAGRRIIASQIPALAA